MLELIVVAQVTVAVRAAEHAAAVVPDGTAAFGADGVLQWAAASVTRQTFSPVAHPRLAEIANSANHSHPGCMHARMSHYAIARFLHALDLAALRARW